MTPNKNKNNMEQEKKNNNNFVSISDNIEESIHSHFQIMVINLFQIVKKYQIIVKNLL